MAVNLRQEAQLHGPQAGIERHERLVATLATNDRAAILAELHAHGTRRFLSRDVAQV